MYLFVLYIFVYCYVVNGVDLRHSSSKHDEDRAAETARLISFISKINDFEEKERLVANNNDGSNRDSDAESEAIKLVQKMLDKGRKFNEMADQVAVVHISNPGVLQIYRNLPEFRKKRRNFAKEQDPGHPNNSINNAEAVKLQSMELFDLVKPIVKKIMTKYKVKIGPEGAEEKENIRKGPEIENETINTEIIKSDSTGNEEKQINTNRTKKKKHDFSNKKRKSKHNVSAGNKHEKRKNKFNEKDKKRKKHKSKENYNSDIIDTKNMMEEHVVDWADYDEKNNEEKSESDTKPKKKRNKWGIKSDSENKKVKKKKGKSKNKHGNTWNKYVDDNLFKDGDNSNKKRNKGDTTDNDRNNKNDDNESENNLKTRYNVKKYQPDDELRTNQKSSSEEDSSESFRSLKERLGNNDRDKNDVEKKVGGDMEYIEKESWYRIAPNVEDFYGKARKQGGLKAFRTSVPYGVKKSV